MGRYAWPRWGPYLLILLASAAAYLNADHTKFYFDSHGIFWWGVTDLGLAFRKFLLSGPLPDSSLAYLTFALNYALNEALGVDGFDVTSYLVANVLLHALNACLLYALVRALWREVGPDQPIPTFWPLATALLFAVHPLNASSVVYIIQRRGLMAAACYLAALLAYLHQRRLPPTNRRLAWWVFLFACFWVGCKSKTMTLTLPVALLVLEFCLRAPEPAARRRYLKWLVPGLAGCLVMMLAYLYSRGLFDPRHFQIKPWGEETLWGPWPHFLTEMRVFAHYWKLILLPLPRWMCIDHYLPVSYHPAEHGAWAALLLHAGLLLVGVVAGFKRRLLVGFGLLLFYVALIPWTLLPQRELMVEYKTYLSTSAAVLVLAGLARWAQGRIPGRVQVPPASAAFVALLAVTLWNNRVYKSALSLWEDAVQAHPDNPRAWTNYGIELVHHRRYDEAIAAYRKALELSPDNRFAYYNLGNALRDLRRLDEAIGAYRAALELDPHYAEAHVNLGTVYGAQDRLEEAVAEFRAALAGTASHGPKYVVEAKAYLHLGNALFRLGRLPEAADAYRASLAIRPDHYRTHYNLGLVCERLGRRREAAEAFREALRLQPGFQEAEAGLKRVLAGGGG